MSAIPGTCSDPAIDIPDSCLVHDHGRANAAPLGSGPAEISSDQLLRWSAHGECARFETRNEGGVIRQLSANDLLTITRTHRLDKEPAAPSPQAYRSVAHHHRSRYRRRYRPRSRSRWRRYRSQKLGSLRVLARPDPRREACRIRQRVRGHPRSHGQSPISTSSFRCRPPEAAAVARG